MLTNLFKGPKLKIERANEQVLDVNERIKTFLLSSPYEISTQLDPDGGQEWYIATRVKELPEIISVTVGEILYNLRSSLDQAICCLAKHAGISDISGVYFPFAGSKQEFESQDTQKKIKKMHPDVVTIIHHLQPYKGGNDFLWSLNRLCNIDKHQRLIAAGAMTLQMRARLTMKPKVGRNIIQAPKSITNPFDKEIKLLSYPAGCKPDGKINVAFDVAFCDVDVVGGHPVSTTLQQYVNAVSMIIYAFEASFSPNS